MDARTALAPVEFRFTDEGDVATYGDRWYRYAETDLIRLPARTLIQLEADLGMPIVDVMNGMRLSTVLGDTAAAWLGVRAEDPERAGPFDQFNPITMLIHWRKAVDEGKDEAPTEQEVTPDAPATPALPDGFSPVPGPWHREISDPAPTVTLQTLPIAE